MADYNAEISKIESKTRSISGLTATPTLSTVEIEIPDHSSLVKEKQVLMQKLLKLKRKSLLL